MNQLKQLTHDELEQLSDKVEIILERYNLDSSPYNVLMAAGHILDRDEVTESLEQAHKTLNSIREDNQ